MFETSENKRIPLQQAPIARNSSKFNSKGLLRSLNMYCVSFEERTKQKRSSEQKGPHNQANKSNLSLHKLASKKTETSKAKDENKRDGALRSVIDIVAVL